MPDPGPPALRKAPSGGGEGSNGQGGSPGSCTNRPPLWDDPNHEPGPGRYSTSNETDPPPTGPVSPPQGSQINRAARPDGGALSAPMTTTKGGVAGLTKPPSIGTRPYRELHRRDVEKSEVDRWRVLHEGTPPREYETATDSWDKLDAARRNTLLNKLYHHVAKPIAAGAGKALDGMAHLLGDTPGTLEQIGSSIYAGARLLYNDPEAVGEAAYRVTATNSIISRRPSRRIYT